MRIPNPGPTVVILHIFVVLLLITATLPVAADDKNEALLSAAVRGDVKEVETLLNHGADPNVSDKSDRTVLMQAAGRGRLEVVKLILDKGADINAVNKGGATALIAASGRGGFDIVKLLVDRGACRKPDSIDGNVVRISE